MIDSIFIPKIVYEEVSLETFLASHVAMARVFKDDKDRCLDLYRHDVRGSDSKVRVASIDLTLKEWEELDGVMYKDSHKLVEFAKANKERIKIK